MEDQETPKELTYQQLYNLLYNQVNRNTNKPLTLFNVEDGAYYRLLPVSSFQAGRVLNEDEEDYLFFVQRVDSPVTC